MAERLSFSTSRQYSSALGRVGKLEEEIIGWCFQRNARCQREAELSKRGWWGSGCQAKQRRKVQRGLKSSTGPCDSVIGLDWEQNCSGNPVLDWGWVAI